MSNQLRNILVHLALIAIVVLQACSHKNDRQGHLLFWSSNNAPEIEFARKVIGDWNKDHPEDQVDFQPIPEGQSSEEIILAAVVGRTTPDIYANMWPGDVAIYADAKKLIPLDTLDGFLDFIYQRCDSSLIEGITYNDGHIYQVPWKMNPLMMIYNKKLINQLGYKTSPGTYSEYLEAAEKFKKDKDGDGYIDQWIGYTEVKVIWHQRLMNFYPLYLAASGGAPLIKNKKAAFNNQYAIDVFAFLGELYKKEYYSKEQLSAGQDVFLAGKIVTKITGPWEITHSNKFKPEGFEFGFAPIPVPDHFKGPVYSYADPKNVVIFNTCEKPQVAWEFLKSMLNNENDLLLLTLSNQLPQRKNLLDDPYFMEFFENNPMMVLFAEQAKHVKGVDNSMVLKEVLDLISQEYEASVIYGVKSPEDAISDAAKAVDLLFLK